MPSLADIMAGAAVLPKPRTMYNKLKSYELEMDPGQLKTLMDSYGILQGRTDNPWEQVRPPDPDALAAPVPRRLQNI